MGGRMCIYSLFIPWLFLFLVRLLALRPAALFMSAQRQAVCMSTRLSLVDCLSDRPSIHLSVCLSVFPICLCVCLSVPSLL